MARQSSPSGVDWFEVAKELLGYDKQLARRVAQFEDEAVALLYQDEGGEA